MNASVTQLEEEFKKLAPIKSNGIQVRSNKSLDSMHSAIKAPSITIDNREVVIEEVEEKRTTTRGGNSGGGGGFTGHGGGGYFGEWSVGRNEFRYHGEFTNRSKGPTGCNSEVYQCVDQNGNGGGSGGRYSHHQPNKEATESDEASRIQF